MEMRCPTWFLFLVIIFQLLFDNSVAEIKNRRPIIGVIAQEMRNNGRYNESFIAASYVKALEASGARVVPILINKTESYYREMVGYINGVVIPGGSALFNVTGGFATAVKTVYRMAKEINEKKDQIFPIIGVCQGMEILSFIAANESTPLVPCDADNINLPLNFKSNYQYSKLYKHLRPDLRTILKTMPVTNNHHSFCLTEENFKNFGLDQDWIVLSTNQDRNGLQFVSSMESKSLPIVGVQFHPEKPAYEWNPEQHNPHDFPAILVNRYFYDWIVNVAKYNEHQFPDKKIEKKMLIYNYKITYTPDGYDLEMYYFYS